MPSEAGSTRPNLLYHNLTARIYRALGLTRLQREAKAAEHYARLLKASNKARADRREVVKLAEIRMAAEIEAGQKRGKWRSLAAIGSPIYDPI